MIVAVGVSCSERSRTISNSQRDTKDEIQKTESKIGKRKSEILSNSYYGILQVVGENSNNNKTNGCWRELQQQHMINNLNHAFCPLYTTI
jgi:hypothetical protein